MNSNSNIKSMFGIPVRKMSFKTNWERSKWIETSKNIPLFEKLSPIKQYLLNKYIGQEHTTEFSKYPFRIFNFDIEVEIDGKFPDPLYADFPINIISLYDTLSKSIHVWAYNKNIFSRILKENQEKIIKEVKEYDSAPVYFHLFDKEHELLEDFISFWENNFPDIITRLEY